jgi:hypothetical protein
MDRERPVKVLLYRNRREWMELAMGRLLFERVKRRFARGKERGEEVKAKGVFV